MGEGRGDRKIRVGKSTEILYFRSINTTVKIKVEVLVLLLYSSKTNKGQPLKCT